MAFLVKEETVAKLPSPQNMILLLAEEEAAEAVFMPMEEMATVLL